MGKISLRILQLLIKLLLPVTGACAAGGWVLFQVAQGASTIWLIIPLLVIGTGVWWIRLWHTEYTDFISRLPTQQHRCVCTTDRLSDRTRSCSGGATAAGQSTDMSYRRSGADPDTREKGA